MLAQNVPFSNLRGWGNMHQSWLNVRTGRLDAAAPSRLGRYLSLSRGIVFVVARRFIHYTYVYMYSGMLRPGLASPPSPCIG